MLMKLKNKMTLSLEQLCKKTEKEGGIPSVIEMSVQEASQLLDELNRMRDDDKVRERYKITTERDGLENARFIIFRKDGIGQERRHSFLKAWHEGAYTVAFDAVPLVLVIPKQQKQVETQAPPNPGHQAPPNPGHQAPPNPGHQAPPSPGPQSHKGELTLTE